MIKTDLMIIGAGPAGCSAAIYAVRSGVKTMIAGGAMPGGQLLQTNDLENYAGFENPVGGFELMTAMHKQCKRLGVEILTDKIVSRLWTRLLWDGRHQTSSSLLPVRLWVRLHLYSILPEMLLWTTICRWLSSLLKCLRYSWQSV